MEKKNYFKIIRELESEIIDEIKEELNRLGRVFTSQDNDALEFYNFDVVSELNLDKIQIDGEVVCYDGVGHLFTTTFHSLLDNNDLNIADIISLLNELREL